MRYSSLLVLAAATLSVAAPTPAGPNPNDVFIEGLNYAGSGCGAGTLVYTTTSDKTAITLLFEEYIASIGPGSTIADSRKNCAVTLNVHIPSGFQFSITTVEYTGFENLDAGVSAVQDALYFFTGQILPPVSASHSWKGPSVGNTDVTDTFGVESWSPCGGVAPLILNNEIYLTSHKPSASGLITIDTETLKFVQTLHIQYRACS